MSYVLLDILFYKCFVIAAVYADFKFAFKADMTQEFLTYARPLIQAELTPFFIAGLPRHIVNHG